MNNTNKPDEGKKMTKWNIIDSVKDDTGGGELEAFGKVISDRINYFANKHHKYEANELHNALNVILRLVPPSSFAVSPTPEPVEKEDDIINQVIEALHQLRIKSSSLTNERVTERDLYDIQMMLYKYLDSHPTPEKEEGEHKIDIELQELKDWDSFREEMARGLSWAALRSKFTINKQ